MISDTQATKFSRLTKCHYLAAQIICKETDRDMFQLTIEILRLYAETAVENGFDGECDGDDEEKKKYSLKIKKGLNRQSYGLDGFHVPLSSNPEVQQYFDQIPTT